METWRKLPILTAAQSRDGDVAAEVAGVDRSVLMERAGAAVARAICARWSPRETLVLCGPGDNGGDGWIAARVLAERGWPVTVAAFAGRSPSAAARRAAETWPGPTTGFVPERSAGARLIVDAVFGSGLSRPLERKVVAMLRAAETTSAPIVAVDLPSGLQSDTAAVLGFASCVTLTVALHALKPAHVLEAGRHLCGETIVANIGLPPPDARLHLNAPALWRARLHWPAASAHKTQRGRLVVVGGDAAMTGAARLSSRAGLRIGAGLVTLLSPSDALLVNAAALEAVMVRPFETEAELAELAASADAAVIGPGAGVDEATADNLLALALTVFRHDPRELFSVLDRDDVLTPHVGEFDRIFPGLLKRSPERITAARTAASEAGAIVVLKGSDTVIAAPDGRAAINGGERERVALARDRRLGRRAGRADRWAAGAGGGELRSRLRRGLDPRAGGFRVRSRPDRRGPARPHSGHPAQALPRALSA